VTPEDLERLRSLTCAKWNHYDADVIPAWVADMDLPPAPVSVEAVRALVDRGDFGYTWAASSKLPEAFAAWQERNHGWRPPTDELRLFCDVVQAVETSVWLHTKPGDGVVVFTPVYPPFLGTVKAMDRRIVECPLDPDGWRLDPGLLASVIDETTRVILTCNPHNPTGHVFTRDELEAIAAVAEERDLLVVSDEIWSDLVHSGFKHIPFPTIGEDAARRSVTVSAASKAFNLAGLRCSVAHLGHAGVAEAVKALPSHVLGAVSSPGAEASLAAWTRGESWLDQTRAFLTSQRDHLAARLAEELPAVGFSLPDATYLAWLDFRELGLGDTPAVELLERARVGLSDGTDFGSRGAGFARLNFATTRPILDEIVDRIVRTVG
jgi:cystathionine beta-lyase